MIGYAVIIRREDGSHYFSLTGQGMHTPVRFLHAEALAWAKELREHRIDAQVVKVEYSDPVIIGPKRFLSPSQKEGTP